MKKILVVDDEESIRLLFHDELTQAGYQVELACSGEEALEKVCSNPPHLITLDIKMNGEEFRLKPEIQELPTYLAVFLIGRKIANII